MSNKTQLQTNNTSLSSLITTLQGKAAGSGSSSGGGVETCTVTLTTEDGFGSWAIATLYKNGEISTEEVTLPGGDLSCTISDAVVGGVVIIQDAGFSGSPTIQNGVLIRAMVDDFAGITTFMYEVRKSALENDDPEINDDPF